ncbi:exo-beta-D-glucosaminidase [Rhizodiscina lignyota]|uniref:Exo-beta-D-glucosaminidase n=1 Tax=Rhizodiscina lignyota TaxID=1504668 RepID=A0A9P4M7J3_9PEZI|nr:exo-beta-D-glucosaminidase [Rhizodiscina lignyota]
MWSKSGIVAAVQLSAFVAAAQQYGRPFLSGPGSKSLIPGWSLQSSAKTGSISSVSHPSVDTSSWYNIGPRATVFGGLLDAGVYTDTQLWYHTNLVTTPDYSEFAVPWIYRHEFSLSTGKGSHYFLITNGITSKADVYLNGHEIASKLVQAGAYGGLTFDITNAVGKENALAIQAYPTDYNLDFALGFVDWNPYPPDNGTGVWRDVYVKETGPVALGSLRIVTDYAGGSVEKVNVMLKVAVTNLEDESVTVKFAGAIEDESGSNIGKPSTVLKLSPHESKTVTLSTSVSHPKIWWPKRWGGQPLYAAQISATVGKGLSDITEKRNFGIRHVTSHVNEHNDTIFAVNGHPFQAIGGGYSPDMFLRWDSTRFTTIAQYMLDMGLNTLRLEGKSEHPELYDIADRLGLMIMPGWECCDKWEGWSYNDEVSGVPLWNANDYQTANHSIRHEAAMMQSHPSILAFLVGSDFYPNDAATAIYVTALDDFDWQNPIICSAGKLGYPKLLGPSGMKMVGPYDWVPPDYWYTKQLGAAFGFGSELGAGVGTPEKRSLQRFLTESDQNDLWQHPDKTLYHMSTNVSSFFNRKIYDTALWHRHGPPTSLDNYLIKAQMMDYEATKAEFEAYGALWSDPYPATGAIYWMLNNAWPSLHWNLFDYYLHPAGAYFGTKAAARDETAAYDYMNKTIYLINRSLAASGSRTIDLELLSSEGKSLSKQSVTADTEPDSSKIVISNVKGIESIKGVAFLRLLLSDAHGEVLSKNVYWLSNSVDEMDFDNSTWYYTPVTKYSDYTALSKMSSAHVKTSVKKGGSGYSVTLENTSGIPAVFIGLNVVGSDGNYVEPVFWSDNYVTLWPKETVSLDVSFAAKGAFIELRGMNVAQAKITLS